MSLQVQEMSRVSQAGTFLLLAMRARDKAKCHGLGWTDHYTFQHGQPAAFSREPPGRTQPKARCRRAVSCRCALRGRNFALDLPVAHGDGSGRVGADLDW